MQSIDLVMVTRDDLRQALREIATYIDVTLDDLMEIYERAVNHALIRRAESVPVADLMAREVFTIGADEPLLEAGRRFLEHHVSALPVVDADMQLLGIITEADLLTLAGLPHHHRKGSRLHDLWDTLTGHQHSTPTLAGRVADLMSSAVVTVREQDTLNDACERMRQTEVKTLVVTDERNRVTGIVSRSTVIKGLLMAPGL
ncbi:MAG: CBS domain-containing protein [Thiohalobacteraceae bacterium]